MHKRKCTGANCPMQVGYVVPETCPEPEKCRYATFPQTNADRIREMTDKQLAIFLGDVDCCNPNPCGPGMYCGKCWLDWLKAPADEQGGDEE